MERRRSSITATTEKLKIISLNVKDVRFPTSLMHHGSDAMHLDPDYSCAYVTIALKSGQQGNGLTFTCGRGTELVVAAINCLKDKVLGCVISEIFADFATFWRTLCNDTQMRWLGPEKGVIHLAVAAIVNALWDLWAKLLKKPLWQLLADMEPELLVSTIDFRYLGNALTKDEAIELLAKGRIGREQRVQQLLEHGYPAYTTQAGWLGYNAEVMQAETQKALKQGFKSFKLKVGQNLYEDVNRLERMRDLIGWNNDEVTLMVDANQVWEVREAIDWMENLATFKPLWIEEPTSPDDVLGHQQISEALRPLGIGIATGEVCCNRVLFKQFLQMGAVQYCQIDAARIGGVNEVLSVYLMCKKFGVKVCPHAGGVGLCEMVQHLQMWDFVALSGTTEGRMIEYVDQLHEHFVDPVVIQDGCYMVPKIPGYSTTMKIDSLKMYQYPNGSEWENMFSKGLFHDPRG